MKKMILVSFCTLLMGVGMAFPAASSAQEEIKVLDVCCYDLDGGGPPDDGILIVSRGGREILMAIIYEDPDKNKKFDTADKILAIAVGPHLIPSVAGR